MDQSATKTGTLVGKRLGKYEILALLAVGGSAEIYLARVGGAAGFEKYVVVKCLLGHLAEDPDYVRMFLDEARLCAHLEHSNIVQTLELGEHENRYYIVMEYLAGMSLAQLARRSAQRVAGGLMPIDIIFSLSAQAAAGLHYAHEKSDPSGSNLGVVHRDVSPQNLVVTFDGILKLVDFGIAKAKDRQTQTRTGTIKGKFAYMSPEQCQAKEIDRTTDIFALGVIVHELVTGRRLFKRPTSYETYQAIIGGNYPNPSQVNHRLDPAVDEIIMKAVAFRREDRYQTAEEFGTQLLGHLHRRGKSIGAGDISRYYDEYFQKELDEHSARMRKLIEGRQDGETRAQWDEQDEGGAGGRAALLETVPSLSSSGAATVASRRNDGPDDGSDDGDTGATRVELNPLEKIQRLHDESTQPTIAETRRSGSRPVAPPLMSRGATPSQPPNEAPTRADPAAMSSIARSPEAQNTSKSRRDPNLRSFTRPGERTADDATRNLVQRVPERDSDTATHEDTATNARDTRVDDDEEAETLLAPGGFIKVNRSPDGPTLSDATETATATTPEHLDFGAPNPGDESTGAQTRNVLGPRSGQHGPEPLFANPNKEPPRPESIGPLQPPGDSMNPLVTADLRTGALRKFRGGQNVLSRLVANRNVFLALVFILSIGIGLMATLIFTR